MIRFCATHGGSNFSDDYGFYIQFLAKFWNGDATVKDFLITSMHGPHFVAIPLALRMIALRAGYWSPGLEISVTFVVAFFRTLFLYLIFAPRLKNVISRCAVALIACTAIFSPAQLSLFVYGDAGITMGLDNLGFLFGVWGVLRFPNSWRGVVLACCGGLLSTASWGVGVCWLVFVIAMYASEFRYKRHYLTIFIAALISHVPMIIRTVSSHGSADGVISLFNPLFILGALGRPMALDVTRIDVEYVDGLIAGCIAILISCVLIPLSLTRQKNGRLTLDEPLIPSILLMIYTLLCLYEVSVFRGGIGSWYTALSENFWIALSLLALRLCEKDTDRTTSKKFSWNRIVGGCVMLVLATLFLRSNTSYQDKTAFLSSRSLSAESCVRHYENSPTFCELLVFMWQPTYEFQPFSRFFESTQTSVFGTHQTWTVQGDFALSNTEVFEPSTASRIRWVVSDGNKLLEVPWKASERLDMVVGPQGKLKWKLDLSPSVETAHLKTEVRGNAQISLTVDGRNAVLPVPTSGIDHWSAVDIPLNQFSGKSIVVTFSNSGETRTADIAVFRYPRVEIRQTRRPQRASEIYRGGVVPVATNTDASDQFPKATAGDLVLEPLTTLVWKDMYQHAFMPKDRPVCVGDYRAIEFFVALPDVISKRWLRMMFHVIKPDGSQEDVQADMALREDDHPHGYSYDLRLLSVDYASRISSIRLLSPFGEGSDEEKNVPFVIRNMRLVRKSADGSLCDAH